METDGEVDSHPEFALDRLASECVRSAVLPIGAAQYIDSSSAADVLRALDGALGSDPDETQVVNCMNAVLEGFPPYKTHYVMLRLVPKILIPLVLRKNTTSYRVKLCFKAICVRCADIAWDPIILSLLEAIRCEHSDGDDVLNLAKMLARDYVTPSAQVSSWMLSYLLDFHEESEERLLPVVYQLLECLFSPNAERAHSVHRLAQPLLRRFLETMCAAPQPLRDSAIYGNVLFSFVESYNSICRADHELEGLLDKCVFLYRGMLKEPLEKLSRKNDAS